ncbi:hypothetical protein BZG36_00388 [Bifiguratus adelaidae]|uniref:AD domain-containing protein n=1 Tax=Bifiguratus adelaidae TaxID=1938954 RepID=A0A261Y7X3_9FUNG|nr:hypothetical protein BZG36_00388 [Bifiguratus adelaidae]
MDTTTPVSQQPSNASGKWSDAVRDVSNGGSQSNRTTPEPKDTQPPVPLVGMGVKATTAIGEEVSGTVFTYDTTTNCLSRAFPGSSKSTFKILKISHLKDFALTPVDPNTPSIVPEIKHISLDRVRAREAAAVKEAQQRLARIGEGVTTEAQDIFDALSKTLPCRWAKDSIVVLDEVIISPPYDVANCKANASSSASLARVKKVLEGEKKRLQSAK